MNGLRVLAMDHFFDQEVRALEAHPRLDVRRFPYQRLRNPALRILGAAVGDGLSCVRPTRARSRAASIRGVVEAGRCAGCTSSAPLT